MMDWPPYSPDLNPIENLWKMLKAEIDRTHPELKGLENSAAVMDFILSVRRRRGRPSDLSSLISLLRGCKSGWMLSKPLGAGTQNTELVRL